MGHRYFIACFPRAVHKTDAVPSCVIPSRLSLSPLLERENTGTHSPPGDPTSANEVSKHWQGLNTALYPVILYTSDRFLIFTGQVKSRRWKQTFVFPTKRQDVGAPGETAKFLNKCTPNDGEIIKHFIPTSNDTFPPPILIAVVGFRIYTEIYHPVCRKHSGEK